MSNNSRISVQNLIHFDVESISGRSSVMYQGMRDPLRKPLSATEFCFTCYCYLSILFSVRASSLLARQLISYR